MIILREWQSAALPRCLEAVRSGKRGIVSAVMGSGKSVLIAEVVAAALEGLPEHWRIVVTTPTVRLVEQLHATLEERIGPVGMWYTHASRVERVTVACIPSAPSLAEHTPDCALWIADEAHRTESATIQATADALHPYASLGFTATPYLSDSRRRLHHFDELVHEYGVQRAIADGVVVPPEVVHYSGTETFCDAAIREMVALEDGPGLITATDILDAEEYAETIPGAAAIHSRLSRRVQTALLDRLRTGDLRCLVQVRLLSEGVDLPWLRWLALRVPISGRVPFCQLVGRVLRSSPGKTSARILDPLDLFNVHGLSFEAMLGGGGVEESEDDELRGIADTARESLHVDMPVFYSAMASYLRKLALALYAIGAVQREVKGGSWRRDFASGKQIACAVRMRWATQHAPEPHRGMLRDAIAAVQDLTRGDVSDLLEVLFYLGRVKTWPQLGRTEDAD
jgi:hypothetical protein